MNALQVLVISFCLSGCLSGLVACGKGGGTLNLQVDQSTAPVSTGTSATAKPLFSVWNESSGYYQMDLRNLQLGVTTAVTVTTVSSQNCTCQVLAQGTDSSGTMSFSGCSGSYPDCGIFNSAATPATYSKTSSVLQICESATGCTDLK